MEHKGDNLGILRIFLQRQENTKKISGLLKMFSWGPKSSTIICQEPVGVVGIETESFILDESS